MKVIVTEEDIKKGQRCSISLCPIALATRRIPEVINSYVLPGSISLLSKFRTERVSFKPPQEVKDFIIKFDNGNEVHPFEFELQEQSTIKIISVDECQ